MTTKAAETAMGGSGKRNGKAIDSWLDNDESVELGTPTVGEHVLYSIRATTQKASYVSLGAGILESDPTATRVVVRRWCKEESVGGARWFLTVFGLA